VILIMGESEILEAFYGKPPILIDFWEESK
jgi:hypothetical protein